MAQPAFRYVQTDTDHFTVSDQELAGHDVGYVGSDRDSPVAALHATILERFAALDAGNGVVPSPATDRVEASIAFVSRWGGVALFVAAFTGVLLAIF